jgi:general secretion pathway protein M
MSWFRSHQRAAWICGLTLALPLLAYLITLSELVGMYSSYQTHIGRTESRVARLQGLIEQQNKLSNASQSALAQVVELVYPGNQDSAAISTTLQTGVRQIFTSAGLSVTNSQVLPVREQDDFDYIGLRITVSGPLDALDAALLDLTQYQPLVLLESLGVRPEGRVRRGAVLEQKITATLQILTLRAQG